MAMNNHSRQGGFTLMELLVVVIIGAILTTYAVRYMVEYTRGQTRAVVADQLKVVTNATLDYIADNKQAILLAAGATTPYVIATSDLASGGYLPAGFATKNAFGQSYETRVVQPSAGVLLPLLLTTGGTTLDDGDTVRIAQILGAAGGLIPSTDSTKAQGTYGGWQVALSPYNVTPGKGHLAVALFVASATAAGIASASPGQSQRFFAPVPTGIYDGAFSPSRIMYSYVNCPPGWTRESGGVVSGNDALSADTSTWPSYVHAGPYGAVGWRAWLDVQTPFYLTPYVDCTPP